MSHKKFRQPACGLPAFKRRRNVKMRCGFIYSTKRNLAIGNFFQSRSQTFRITSQKRAGSVGQKFSLSGNGQLDNGGGNRRKNGQNYTNEHHYHLGLTAAIPVVSSASEKMRSQKEIRHKRHKSDKYNDNCGNKNVFIADMGKLVGDNSFQFVLIKNLPQAGGYRHGCVFLVSAGSESVRRRVVDHINFWRLEPGRNAKIFHYSVKLKVIPLLYRPRARHRQD